MYTSSATSATNSQTPFNPGWSAVRRLRVDTATDKAEAAYEGLLCRNPRDFVSFGSNVAKDVAVVNAATECLFQAGAPSNPAILSAAAGDPVAATALQTLGILPASSQPSGGPLAGSGGGGRSRRNWRGSQIGASCDPGAAGGGAITQIPLNGGGGPGITGGSGSSISGVPAVLTLGNGIQRRNGRWAIGPQNQNQIPAGMSGCPSCADLQWGDAYPNGVPTPESAAGVLLSWLQANPWLALGIAAGGLFLAAGGGKKRG